MTQRDVAAVIAAGADGLGVSIDDDVAGRLAEYVELLGRWTARVDLVAPAAAEVLAERHVVDSLALLRLLDDPQLCAPTLPGVDVGSGAGLPGLVLGAARPERAWTLVEPRQRRAAFLNAARAQLQVEAEIVEVRLEAMEQTAQPQLLVSRATFAPYEWSRRAQAVAAPGSVIIIMCGPSPPNVLVERADAIDRFALPSDGAARVNLLLRV